MENGGGKETSNVGFKVCMKCEWKMKNGGEKETSNLESVLQIGKFTNFPTLVGEGNFGVFIIRILIPHVNRSTRMYTSRQKIHKDKDAEPTEFEESVAQESCCYPCALQTKESLELEKKFSSKEYEKLEKLSSFYVFINVPDWLNLWADIELNDALDKLKPEFENALTEGGFEHLYKQIFPTDPNEQLKKTFACYLSTTTGPVAGTLYLSSTKVAFCSDRPLSFKAPSGLEAWS
ncbi:GEM-like protein 5 [Capsicum chinense]|nr:GEM-like protein 5 [Capsicum chinense]